MFDAISFLEEYDIDYRTSGKNVSQGWVEINCPFCADPSFHMGINLSSGKHHCWNCGQKGYPEVLVKRLLDISYREAKQIVQNHDDMPDLKEDTPDPVSHVLIPKMTEKTLPAMHRKYLQNRGFDPDYLVRTYNLKGCLHLGGEHGEYAYRLIIPIIMGNRIVSYTARDVTGQAKSKYKHLSNEKSIVPVKQCIYNIDTVQDKIIILEGTADVWRVGSGSVAMFGTEFTTTQLNMLFSKNLSEAYVMFDEGAIKKAERLAYTLTTFIPKVEIIEMDQGDPAELPEEEVKKLREEIGI